MAVSFDVHDPAEVAAFWGALLGTDVVPEDSAAHVPGDETRVGATGTFTILNPGSLHDRIDFSAIDQTSGLTLRISLIDDNLPFIRTSAEGTVSSGHCVYEYDEVQQ